MKSVVRSVVASGLVLLASVWGGAAAGCSSSATDSPLGGAFGGKASVNPAPSSGSGSSGGVDSGAPSGDDAGGSGSGAAACPPTIPAGTTAPTWSTLYTNYFAAGTVGDCADSACHTEMSTATAAYTWLQTQTTDCSAPNCLATISSCTGSVLTWFGGSMPLAGPTSEPQAAIDVTAWVAAGSQNN